ncbi:MAG: nucleotidyltransferase domain-containing protein [Candidatus Aenigmatarchaeota archaeon]
MLHECDSIKLLSIFFKEPSKEFHLRALARLMRWGPGRVERNLEEYIKASIILKEQTSLINKYKANTNSNMFKSLKLLYTLNVLLDALDELDKKLLYPEAIVLFGSASKGEDLEKSDVDLCVIGSEKQIDVKSIEKQLNRKVNIIFLQPNEVAKAKKEFLNNLINGIVLKGYLKVL